MIEQDIIEDWRFKIKAKDTLLERVNGSIAPRYVCVDQIKLTRMKKQYLVDSDLTDISLEEVQPTELKLTDFKETMLRGMLKTLITNPSLLKQLHEETEQLIKGQPNTKLVDTSEIMSVLEQFRGKYVTKFIGEKFHQKM